jgi:hypothetical protein
MKRFLSIIVITVFTLHFAGFYVYYAIRLLHIRQEMRNDLNKMPLHELQKLTLSADEYERSKVGDDEVKLAGKMYDIAQIERVDNQIVIYAVHDEAEDSLLAFLNTVIKRGENDKKPLPQGLLALAGLQYLPSIFQVLQPVFLDVKSFTHYLVSNCTFYPDLLSPPPRQ